MRDHPAPEILELFVIDGLDQAGSAAVAAHVRECKGCAAALAREARLELALAEVAAAHSKTDSNRKAAPITALKNADSKTAAANGADSSASRALAARRARLQAGRKVRRVAGFAAAAAAVAAIWLSARAPAPAPLPTLVTCLEATDEAGCVASARRAGLVVQVPTGAAARFDRADEDSSGPMDSNQGE